MKYIIILVMTLLGYIPTNAQKTGQPIRSYKENNYSIAEVKTLAFASDSIAPWWRENLVMLVNNGLAARGKSLRVDETNINWILDHATYKYREYGSYTNSHLLSGTPGWYIDSNGWKGMVAVFEYDGVSVDLFKGMCTNLVNIPLTPLQNPPPTSTILATASNGQPIIINNYNIMENSGNATIQNSGNSDVAVTGGAVPQTYSYVPGYDPGPIYPTRNVYQQSSGVRIGVRLNFTSGGGRRCYGPQGTQQVIQPRTMPPGIPAGNTPGGVGLDATPRGMPGGIGR